MTLEPSKNVGILKLPIKVYQYNFKKWSQRKIRRLLRPKRLTFESLSPKLVLIGNVADKPFSAAYEKNDYGQKATTSYFVDRMLKSIKSLF